MSNIVERFLKDIDKALEKQIPITDEVVIERVIIEEPSRDVERLAERYCNGMEIYYGDNGSIMCIGKNNIYIIGQIGIAYIDAKCMRNIGARSCIIMLRLKVDPRYRRENGKVTYSLGLSLDARCESECNCLTLYRLFKYGREVKLSDKVLTLLKTCVEAGGEKIELDPENGKVKLLGEGIELDSSGEFYGSGGGRSMFNLVELGEAYEKVKPSSGSLIYPLWNRNGLLMLHGREVTYIQAPLEE